MKKNEAPKRTKKVTNSKVLSKSKVKNSKVLSGPVPATKTASKTKAKPVKAKIKKADFVTSKGTKLTRIGKDFKLKESDFKIDKKEAFID